MRSLITHLFVVLLLTTASAQAKDLADATDKLCQKVKACGQEELARQELTPEMRQLMEPMFDGMCQSIVAPYLLSNKSAALESKAVACLNSFLDKSCEDLMENDGGHTKECREFKKAADEAYPNGHPEK